MHLWMIFSYFLHILYKCISPKDFIHTANSFVVIVKKVKQLIEVVTLTIIGKVSQ
jgi:hypothetical protein